MIEYVEKLKDPRWQKKRLQVFERAGWKCQSCEDKSETLEVHHLIYCRQSEPWDAPFETLECLCSTCHEHREQFNDFFGGRSRFATIDCLNFWDFYGTAFGGKMEYPSNWRNYSTLTTMILQFLREGRKKERALNYEI